MALALNWWILVHNRVGKRRVTVLKYMKSDGDTPFAHPTGL
jgi:hypothetical protein